MRPFVVPPSGGSSYSRLEASFENKTREATLREATLGSTALLIADLHAFFRSVRAGKDQAPAGSGSNWAQWRGPDSQGISNEKNLPTEWSETKNVLWKTPIPGLGFSSPIIWEKKVFLTTAIEGGPPPRITNRRNT